MPTKGFKRFPRPCRDCGGMYEPAGRQYRYCPGCAEKRLLIGQQKAREGQARWREKVRLEKEMEKKNENSSK
jgi:Zn finger protein HypA/HybF involved in hydrogenase expression